MRLQIFRSLWTNGNDLDGALVDCQSGVFDGIEGPVPTDAAERHRFTRQLRSAAVPFIAEITTGGGYVPDTRDSARHLDDFRRKTEASLECSPAFLTVLAGCDAWPLAMSVEFFGRALETAASLGVAASFETHRSRATFNPWTTRDLLRQLPTLRLTCDFSHWCCVCERLVLEEEPEILALCAERAHHIHARVGYEQGPQVPHPEAPEYRAALEAHGRWWRILWSAAKSAGREAITMTPEFGPDGYLHTLPFSANPVASLDEINHWMARHIRDRFTGAMIEHPPQKFHSSSPSHAAIP